jgi:hypothetical protein
MPAPTPDFRSYELKYDDVDGLVNKLTTALVNLEDKSGKYKYKSE